MARRKGSKGRKGGLSKAQVKSLKKTIDRAICKVLKTC